MVNKKFTIEFAHKILKFFALAFFYIFCIFGVDHYYKIRDYASKLYDNVKIIVFFNKNFNDDLSLSVIKKIKDTGLVDVKEYVTAQEACLRAIEKNPFLKNIVEENNFEIIQSYAVTVPKFIPNEKFLLNVKNMLNKIHAIDELVYDTFLFNNYVKIKNLLLFYMRVFFIFSIIIFILFILKCILFMIKKNKNTKKLISNIFLYLLVSIFSYVVLLIICFYMHYPLSICMTSIGVIIFFTTAFEIILR
ncbi:MAG: hypothetical protein LBJ68_01270 [Endomicrobium sp.]|jgi:cell division transport system permease protein|nr:hypothetical protein [Endomicrobium sp.]